MVCGVWLCRAGMSHTLFAVPGTQVLEIRPPQYRRPHFVGYSLWAGCGYLSLDVGGNHVHPAQLLHKLEEVMSHPREAM